jgi:hypothetical protein
MFFVLVVLFLMAQTLSMKKLSIASWNLNGIRSFFKHDSNGNVLSSLIEKKNLDLICFQETKIQVSLSFIFN